ncbi:MAG: DUF3795 domain-containing protein [Candidatus Izemoplasmatales bacterium]|jgi:hypothetical protein|nr:DUF3795 domain-containing protein [Candidatus Izemoplasmatales bacterium]MDD3864698.1 DUF3795 domain-containing protein [Candidatus Izemoplasmatales bacterium]
MNPTNEKKSTTMSGQLFAPCGINCGVCVSYLRKHKPCAGCLQVINGKLPHPMCKIRFCVHGHDILHCFECKTFPCERIKHLDLRYRKNYGISLILNSLAVKENGVETFMEREARKWECPSCHERLSIHLPNCWNCQQPNPFFPSPKNAGKTN